MSGIQQQMLVGGGVGRVVYAGLHLDGNLTDTAGGAWTLIPGSDFMGISGTVGKFGGSLIAYTYAWPDPATQGFQHGAPTVFNPAVPWGAEFFFGAGSAEAYGGALYWGVKFSAGSYFAMTLGSGTQWGIIAALENSASANFGYHAQYCGDIWGNGAAGHLHLGWDGATYRFFLNGTQVYSVASTQVMKRDVLQFGWVAMGAEAELGADANSFYLDDLIITNQPRTANFTVPTAPFV